MIDELTQAIENAKTGTPDQSVESAIMIYLAAQAEIERFKAVQEQAKALITDVMAETERTKYHTACGSAAISAASSSVAYDAKALDILCASMPSLAEVLEPHRKVRNTAGSLRITAAK